MNTLSRIVNKTIQEHEKNIVKKGLEHVGEHLSLPYCPVCDQYATRMEYHTQSNEHKARIA